MLRYVGVEVVLVVVAVLLLVVSLVPMGGSREREIVVTSGKALGLHLGNVSEGIVLNKEVRLRNNHDFPIRIDGVVASCGCTAVEVPEGEIAPGQEVPLWVSIDTGGRNGLNRFRVSISISGAPPATVVFGANIVEKG